MSSQLVLIRDLLDQLGVPIAVVMIFAWLYSNRRPDGSGATAIPKGAGGRDFEQDRIHHKTSSRGRKDRPLALKIPNSRDDAATTLREGSDQSLISDNDLPVPVPLPLARRGKPRKRAADLKVSAGDLDEAPSSDGDLPDPVPLPPKKGKGGKRAANQSGSQGPKVNACDLDEAPSSDGDLPDPVPLPPKKGKGRKRAAGKSRSQTPKVSAGDPDEAPSSDGDLSDPLPLKGKRIPRSPATQTWKALASVDGIELPPDYDYDLPLSFSLPPKGTPRRRASKLSVRARSSTQASVQKASASRGEVSIASPDSASIGPVSRKTVQDIVNKYKRHTSDRLCKVGDKVVQVRTAWFESFGDHPIRAPPDLRAHPQFQLGDLFFHRLRTSPDGQLWLWSGEIGFEHWIDVLWGYRRDDGLYLTLTPLGQKPSWVGEQRFLQRERQVAALQGVEEEV